MASRIISAHRYAEAVFEIAVEGDHFVPWSGDLNAIASFAAEPDVAGILRSARVPREEKLRLLTAALASSVSPQAMNLVKLLNEHDKVDLAPDIQAIFQQMFDDRRGVAHAVVTTAVPLSDDERSAVAAKLSSLTGKQVDITTMVDQAILGGVVARIGDQLIDGSTRTRLRALKRSLEGAAR